MHVQLVKWGNGQGIRISKSIMDNMGLAVGDHLQIKVLNDKIILQKQYIHKSLEQRAAEYGGKLVSHEDVDWGKPVGREVW